MRRLLTHRPLHPLLWPPLQDALSRPPVRHTPHTTQAWCCTKPRPCPHPRTKPPQPSLFPAAQADAAPDPDTHAFIISPFPLDCLHLISVSQFTQQPASAPAMLVHPVGIAHAPLTNPSPSDSTHPSSRLFTCPLILPHSPFTHLPAHSLSLPLISSPTPSPSCPSPTHRHSFIHASPSLLTRRPVPFSAVPFTS